VLLFLLASRYCEVDSELKDLKLDAVWQVQLAGRACKPFATSFSAHPLRLYAGSPHANGARSLPRTHRSLSRLHAPGNRFLPHAEHSGAILHWLPGRYWRTRGAVPMDFSAWFEAYLGGQCIRSMREQCPAHWARADGRGRDAADVALTTTFVPSACVVQYLDRRGFRRSA